MGKQAALVLYVLAMVAVVVGVDVLFCRNHVWARLMVNVGIVLVFGAFYVRFMKKAPRAWPSRHRTRRWLARNRPFLDAGV